MLAWAKSPYKRQIIPDRMGSHGLIEGLLGAVCNDHAQSLPISMPAPQGHTTAALYLSTTTTPLVGLCQPLPQKPAWAKSPYKRQIIPDRMGSHGLIEGLLGAVCNDHAQSTNLPISMPAPQGHTTAALYLSTTTTPSRGTLPTSPPKTSGENEERRQTTTRPPGRVTKVPFRCAGR